MRSLALSAFVFFWTVLAVNAFRSGRVMLRSNNVLGRAIAQNAQSVNSVDEVEMAPLLSSEAEKDGLQMESPLKPVAPTEANSFEIYAILTVYFVQGALGLSRLALSFFMKDQLHMSPADMAALGGITTLPWVIKPLYGFLSDGVPIFGYRRRSYLVLAGAVGCLSWLALGFGVANTYSTVLLATVLGSASVAMSDVVVDSIVVERSRSEGGGGAGVGAGEREQRGGVVTTVEEQEDEDDSKRGDLQSLCWGASAVGGIMSAYFSGSLLATVTPQTVFLVTAAFPLLISASGLFIGEQRVVASSNSNRDQASSDTGSAAGAGAGVQTQTQGQGEVGAPDIKAQLSELYKTFKNPSIYLPALFVFVWQATPSADSALFFFTTNELQFQPEFLGQVRLVGSLASLAGVLAFRYTLKDKPIKSVILWTTLLSVPLGLTQVLLTSHLNRQLGIPDKFFALTDTVVLSVLGQIAFMPTLVLAAKLCPPGVEGTLFATLMSIFNLSSTVSSELGSALTSFLGVTESNFDNLSLLVGICAVSNALPLLAINLLDKAPRSQAKNDDF